MRTRRPYTWTWLRLLRRSTYWAPRLSRVPKLCLAQAASPNEGQLRSLQTECEALKDEVTNKERGDFKAARLLDPVWRDLDGSDVYFLLTATGGSFCQKSRMVRSSSSEASWKLLIGWHPHGVVDSADN